MNDRQREKLVELAEDFQDLLSRTDWHGKPNVAPDSKVLEAAEEIRRKVNEYLR